VTEGHACPPSDRQPVPGGSRAPGGHIPAGEALGLERAVGSHVVTGKAVEALADQERWHRSTRRHGTPRAPPAVHLPEAILVQHDRHARRVDDPMVGLQGCDVLTAITSCHPSREEALRKGPSRLCTGALCPEAMAMPSPDGAIRGPKRWRTGMRLREDDLPSLRRWGRGRSRLRRHRRLAAPDSATRDSEGLTMMDYRRYDRATVAAAGPEAPMADGRWASGMKAPGREARRRGGGRASMAACISPFPLHRGSPKGEAQPSDASSPEESVDEASNWTC
jgi:hypothetical protein